MASAVSCVCVCVGLGYRLACGVVSLSRIAIGVCTVLRLSEESLVAVSAYSCTYTHRNTGYVQLYPVSCEFVQNCDPDSSTHMDMLLTLAL